MDVYIPRKALLDWVHEFYPEDKVFASAIINAPAADVAPVRHGRWITTSGEVFPGSGQFLCYSHKHDECGFQYVGMYDNEYDYCPKCGAKMDVGNVV